MADGKRIFILQRILPHYRTGFFKKFCSVFTGTRILYGQPYKREFLKSEEIYDEIHFIKVKNIYTGKSGKTFISRIYIKLVSLKPGIIITGFNLTNLNIYLLFFLRPFLKYKLILWSFGYDPALGFGPDERLKDRIRLKLYNKADAVIFYWSRGKEEIEKYSLPKKHFFVASNTLDTERQFELKYKFDNIGKDKIKKELNVNAKFHFVYIGRLLEDKQIGFLLNAYSIVEKNNPGCMLTIIGDGPEKNKLQELSLRLKINCINFTGEILSEEETGKWIYVSDAFVMPGRLGLSVVHSFCFGTPVISQKKNYYFHGEGISYIKDGINGFLVEDGNVNDFADKMIKIISSTQLSDSLRSKAVETAKDECSIDNMMGGFEKAIRFVSDL